MEMPLTPSRRREILDALSWESAATLLDVRFDTIRNWYHGTAEIPAAIDAWLAAIGELLNTPPQKPERRNGPPHTRDHTENAPSRRCCARLNSTNKR